MAHKGLSKEALGRGGHTCNVPLFQKLQRDLASGLPWESEVGPGYPRTEHLLAGWAPVALRGAVPTSDPIVYSHLPEQSHQDKTPSLTGALVAEGHQPGLPQHFLALLGLFCPALLPLLRTALPLPPARIRGSTWLWPVCVIT